MLALWYWIPQGSGFAILKMVRVHLAATGSFITDGSAKRTAVLLRPLNKHMRRASVSPTQGAVSRYPKIAIWHFLDHVLRAFTPH